MPGVEVRDGYGRLIRIETWETDTMRHAELVARAERWLRGTMRCWAVLTETYSTAWEIPDAIGWKTHASYLVECKTSRSDFKADLKKPHRQIPSQGMGDYRYYMTPPGLLHVEELPENWGLLEARPHQVRVIRRSSRFPISRTAIIERPLLIKALASAQEKIT